MRLDHLLSKEHSGACAASFGVGVGAQSRVLSGCLGTGVLMWVERWHWVTGCEIGDAARCWVLREQVSTVVVVGVPLWLEVVGWQSSSLNGSWPAPGVGVVVGTRWLVVAGPSVL